MLFDLNEREKVEPFLLPPKSNLLLYPNLYKDNIEHINELIKESGDVNENFLVGQY